MKIPEETRVHLGEGGEEKRLERDEAQLVKYTSHYSLVAPSTKLMQCRFFHLPNQAMKAASLIANEIVRRAVKNGEGLGTLIM